MAVSDKARPGGHAEITTNEAGRRKRSYAAAPAVRYGAREEPLKPTPEEGTRPAVKPMILLHFL
jgi:hypothetical protein